MAFSYSQFVEILNQSRKNITGWEIMNVKFYKNMLISQHLIVFALNYQSNLKPLANSLIGKSTLASNRF